MRLSSSRPPELLVELPDGTSQSLDPDRPYSLGRAETADIRLSDLRVSRQQGTLRVESGRWHYEDISTSGTFDATGEPVHRCNVATTTILRLGAPNGVCVTLTPLHPAATRDPAPARRHQTNKEPLPPPFAESIHEVASDSLTLGRSADCDIVIDDLLVSRRHARLGRDANGAWFLEDLDSANGTLVDGTRVDRTTIHDGSRVTLGSSSFVFENGYLQPPDGSRGAVLDAERLWIVVADNLVLLEGISLGVPSGSLTAIVGPSGAGKSTLLRVLTGQLNPTGGSVRVMGNDLYASYEQLRSHIGYVPQDDIVQGQLTARRCLTFGAELRFPEDVSAAERAARITTILEELGLGDHADKPVAKLSGGQRKRVSVALELLTEPDLLLLDEPTTGLDPGYEKSIMELLRRISDDGRAVVVVTHAVANLDLCDQVLFLATGGRLAYVGMAADAPAHFGVDEFAGVFEALEHPAETRDDTSPRMASQSVPSVGTADPDQPSSYPNGLAHQLSALVRRHVEILLADPRTLVVYALAAVIPAILLALIADPGALELGSPGTADARMLIGAMAVTVSVLGVANGAREIVKELPGYRRERAAGLRRSAYLLSKLVVLGAIIVVQTALVVLFATIRAGGPGRGTVFPGRLELFGVLAATGLASLCVGLLISAVMSSSEKAVAAIPLAFVVFWLFSGTVSDLADTPVLSQVALTSPSNWGTAAAAGTVGLLELSPCSQEAGSAPALVCDARWDRGIFNLALSMLALGTIGIVCLLAADVALARKEPLEHMRKRHWVGSAIRRTTSQLR